MKKDKETYFTTRAFDKVGRGQHRHCGPTAITNAVFSLSDTPKEKAEEVYRDIAKIGQRRLIFYNFDFLRFGGTVDFLSPAYLRQIMKHFHLDDVRVHRRQKLSKESLIRALRRGSIIYLQFRHHERYENHHTLVYECIDYGDDVLFKIADGWSQKPVYLSYEQLGKGYMIEIEETSRNQEHTVNR